MCELAEGEWIKAEKTLRKSANESDTPLLNYLAAARAAQAQKSYEQRDEYLKCAAQSTAGAEVAVSLTQAQLQLDAMQLERALATLRHLYQLKPHHPFVLKLLAETYLTLRDFESLRVLLPELRKYQVFSASELSVIEYDTYFALLERAANLCNEKDLSQIWQQIPKKLRTDPRLVTAYCKYLQQLGKPDAAELILNKALAKDWRTSWAELYGKLITTYPAQQLTTAESWLKKHGNDPVLLFCLGNIALRNSLWGKAQDYFEASIKLESKAETYFALGKLLEQLGEKEKAFLYYQRGLERAIN